MLMKLTIFEVADMQSQYLKFEDCRNIQFVSFQDNILSFPTAPAVSFVSFWFSQYTEFI